MSRPRWVVPATFAISIASTAVSAYLTIAHFTSPKVLACASTGVVNCERVTTSAQSEVLGVPVALLGLAWSLAMCALFSPWAWRSAAPWIRTARLATVTIAVAFVLWLVYAELFMIRAICLWCTVVHVLAFALFVIVVFDRAEAAEEG
jgi:uncharacterized membrane protein